jgi:hypothetical protein
MNIFLPFSGRKGRLLEMSSSLYNSAKSRPDLFTNTDLMQSKLNLFLRGVLFTNRCFSRFSEGIITLKASLSSSFGWVFNF